MTYPKQEAIEFFAANAGYSVEPGGDHEAAKLSNGRGLANAEIEAASRGWFVTWSIDRDADTVPTDSYYVSGNPQWEALLWDAEGETVLASLCGIDFAEDYSGSSTGPQGDSYARVVAAVLASEALTEMRPVVQGAVADELAIVAGDTEEYDLADADPIGKFLRPDDTEDDET